MQTGGGGSALPGWWYALVPLRIPAFPKGMSPNVYERGWNVLLKVYSSLNMHHLIRERFHEGVDLSPWNPPQHRPHLASKCRGSPFVTLILPTSPQSFAPLPRCNDRLAIPHALLARLDWQGGGLERARAAPVFPWGLKGSGTCSLTTPKSKRQSVSIKIRLLLIHWQRQKPQNQQNLGIRHLDAGSFEQAASFSFRHHVTQEGQVHVLSMECNDQ